MRKKKSHKEWIKEWFPVSYDHIFISYLPNKDRFEKEFNVEEWETKFLKLQGRLFGGATSYPSRGSYREINAKGKIKETVMIEKTRMILSFINEKDFTENSLKKMSTLLKNFGVKTGQESVAFVVDGVMYYIDIM